jgi:hypothetical protein
MRVAVQRGMKRSIVAIVAALALPAPALAQDTSAPPKDSASRACKAERAEMGVDTFRATYGTNKNNKNAFGKCVSKREETTTEDRKAARSACKAERRADAGAFKARYGTNKSKSNAFGRCVSTTAEAKQQERETEEPAPVA